jgi:hypothetical protein
MKIRYFILFFVILMLTACAQAARSEQLGNSPAPDSPVVTQAVAQEEATNQIEAICFRNSDETQLLMNIGEGYCVQYPIGYDIVLSNEMSIMLVKHSVLNAQDPKLLIQVESANGMDVEQVAEQLIADYSVPGLEVKRASLEIDQEPAVIVDGLTGEDINRQVVVVHNDRVYHMTIIPMAGTPDVQAQAEVLVNTVIQSFTFRVETNFCEDCPPPSETPEATAGGETGSAMISGWVWNDLCDSGNDGSPVPATTPAGCVMVDSPIGPYHADGEMSIDEPLIEGVVVSLGEGACPSTGLAEYSTIVTDLSYSFSSLKAGIYCVSIDPQREPNFSILRPGVWTYPSVTQDVISTTVTVAEGEYKGMVNFGWDFQFQP